MKVQPMKSASLASLAVAALVATALSGCVVETGSTPAAPSTPSPSVPNPALFPPNVGFSPDVTNAAVDACRNAVDAQTDGSVDVVGSEFSQAASVVYMLVGPQRAPWRCLVSNDGRVSEVMFVGSEGGA
jgi:hypothetical protein